MLEKSYQLVLSELLSRRNESGYWEGQLSASALSTATALSAFSLYLIHDNEDDLSKVIPDRMHLEYLVQRSAQWLCDQQNPDGGWGDTIKSYSNSSTTLLVKAAFILADQAVTLPFDKNSFLDKADSYLGAMGGIDGIRARYGTDRTFVIPILTNAALAGIVPWSEVTPLPYELAALPQGLFRFLRLPVVSYAIPALVAIGQVRFHFLPPRFPFIRWIRRWTIKRTLRVLRQMQPASGGYLEAAPLTAFVLMSLVAAGRKTDPVAVAALDFLTKSADDKGSLPIDTNLATWLTTLMVNSISADSNSTNLTCNILSDECMLHWLLSCQQKTKHPFTAAAPGGWAWTPLSGGVPDADDTPGAILALARMYPFASIENQAKIANSLIAGVEWLLNIQNSDGGFPTFCRGWGTLPFDRSSVDLTAHALRALYEVFNRIDSIADNAGNHGHATHSLRKRILKAVDKGACFILNQQRTDGSWLPLWFGNQHLLDDENPYYGTAKVVTALARIVRKDFLSKSVWNRIPLALEQAVSWLLDQQNEDGGWGKRSSGFPEYPSSPLSTLLSTVEETGLVLESLVRIQTRNDLPLSPEIQTRLAASCDRGLNCLIDMVHRHEYLNPSPIGFYFTKLWYFEELYPLLFSLGALAAARESNSESPY